MMDTVLIVDDNPHICGMLTEFCSFTGRPAITAEEGFEAVRLFRENQHKIGMVILDMTLPGISGAQVFWALRQIKPQIKVILSSGSSRLIETRPCPEDEITAFLPKPYSIEKLTALFEKFS
jgi:DNA-binding NtrC family response regulator